MKYLIFADGEIEEELECEEFQAKQRFVEVIDENNKSYIYEKLELVECKLLSSMLFEDIRYEETTEEKKELDSNAEIVK